MFRKQSGKGRILWLVKAFSGGLKPFVVKREGRSSTRLRAMFFQRNVFQKRGFCSPTPKSQIPPTPLFTVRSHDFPWSSHNFVLQLFQLQYRIFPFMNLQTSIQVYWVHSLSSLSPINFSWQSNEALEFQSSKKQRLLGRSKKREVEDFIGNAT